jgi:hypothetical protein
MLKPVREYSAREPISQLKTQGPSHPSKLGAVGGASQLVPTAQRGKDGRTKFICDSVFSFFSPHTSFGQGAGRGRQLGGFAQLAPAEQARVHCQPEGSAVQGHRGDVQQYPLLDRQSDSQQDQPNASYRRRSQEVVNPGGWRDSKVGWVARRFTSIC